MADGQPPDVLLLENRSLRQKLMRIQNLFMQLLIACYSQPNNIGAVLGDIQQVLNESSDVLSPAAGGAASGSAQLLPDSAAALLSLSPNASSANEGVANLQALILEMQQQVAAPSTSLTGASRPQQPSMLPADALQDVPPKPFLDYLSNIEEIWREYKYGDPAAGRPSIMELDSKYGDKWRKKEYVPDLKELKSRQNLYNKRKCVWSEVQRYMSADGLSEDAAISRLQEDVHVFGKGLSRYIDTVLRERQKQRRGAQLLHSVSGGGGSAATGDNADAASNAAQDMLPESASVKRPRIEATGEPPSEPASPRVLAAPVPVVTPVRLAAPTGLTFETLKALGSAEERPAKCSAAAT